MRFLSIYLRINSHFIFVSVYATQANGILYMQAEMAHIKFIERKLLLSLRNQGNAWHGE